MEHYVTLFDCLFLPQGLALHMSMERHVKEYTLWILCVDDIAHDVLEKLQLKRVKLLKLSQLETNELLRVKSLRGKGEYCWTLTPFAPRFVFEADSTVNRVTYIDADIWFRKNPKPIYDEFIASNKHVLITDHAFAPEYDHSALKGQYCVQFMIFTRNGGELVRKWWEDRCIEWCYARHEDGKFGDQKYLDDWLVLFSAQVYVLQNKELMLAPWNAMRFPYGNAVAYHFHALRIETKHRIQIGPYALPRTLLLYVYRPYLEDLRKATDVLECAGFYFRSQASSLGLIMSCLRIFRNIFFMRNQILSSVIKWI